MACLETDFIIDLLRGNKDAIEKLKILTQRNEKLYITPISATELFEGSFKSGNKTKIENVNDMLSVLQILDYDLLLCSMAGDILANLGRNGEKIGDFDSITGAISLRHSEALVTRNLKHFKNIDNLKIETY